MPLLNPSASNSTYFIKRVSGTWPMVQEVTILTRIAPLPPIWQVLNEYLLEEYVYYPQALNECCDI